MLPRTKIKALYQKVTMEIQKKRTAGRMRTPFLMVGMCLFAVLSAFLMWKGLLPLGVLVMLPMSAAFGVLLVTSGNPVALAVPLAVSVTVLQIMGGFTASLSAAVTLLAACVIALQAKQGAEKTQALVLVSLILGGGFLLVFGILYLADGGVLDPEAWFESYHSFFRELKTAFSVQVGEYLDGMDETTLALYAEMGMDRAALAAYYVKMAETAVDTMEVIVPGALILLVQLFAYLAVSLFRIAAKLARVDALLPAPHWHLFPTQVSCIFYVLVSAVYIIVSFFAEPDSALYVVLMNLWLCLLPVMLLCGVRVLLVRLAHPMYRAKTGFLILLFVFGCFFLASVAVRLAIFLLSFLGAQTMSMIHANEAKETKK